MFRCVIFWQNKRHLLEFPEYEHCYGEGNQAQGVTYEINRGCDLDRRADIVIKLPAGAVICVLVPRAVREAETACVL